MALPFKGTWYVVWGGDTAETNHHHDVTNQRYAFDILAVNDKGETHRGEGKSNDDYYAYGREILAPADGVVKEAVDGVPENVPGVMSRDSLLGNAVAIQHSDYEVSYLVHLKTGSARVKVGDFVKRGQVVGLCGNSGRSSEPHLHYHLQNAVRLLDGIGIKVFFTDVVLHKDGQTLLRIDYSPVQGDLITPQ